MERAKRSSRGNGQSAPEPEPGIGRKDLQDPDLTEPGRPPPDGEQEHSDPVGDAGRPVQLKIPATEQLLADE